jgi:hypothetical protein
MNKALEQTGADEVIRDMLKDPLFRIADDVRNRPDHPRARENPDVIASC